MCDDWEATVPYSLRTSYDIPHPASPILGQQGLIGIPDQDLWHDRQCEAEWVEYAFTPCQCEERAALRVIEAWFKA